MIGKTFKANCSLLVKSQCGEGPRFPALVRREYSTLWRDFVFEEQFQRLDGEVYSEPGYCTLVQCKGTTQGYSTMVQLSSKHEGTSTSRGYFTKV